MRAPILLVVLALVGCGEKPAATGAAPPSTPAVAETPAPAAPAEAPKPSYPAAGPEWAKVPLAAGAIGSAHAASEVPATFRNNAGAVACPVMGMAIAKPDDAVSYADHDGVRYFFCCDSCEKLFLDDPTAYANGKYLAAHNLDPSAAPATCGDEEKIEG